MSRQKKTKSKLSEVFKVPKTPTRGQPNKLETVVKPGASLLKPRLNNQLQFNTSASATAPAHTTAPTPSTTRSTTPATSTASTSTATSSTQQLRPSAKVVERNNVAPFSNDSPILKQIWEVREEIKGLERFLEKNQVFFKFKTK